MKQLVSPEQMANLSPTARIRFSEWCREKDYGSNFDDVFVPIVQPSTGILIEFLLDNSDKDNYVFEDIFTQDICDVLFEKTKAILEQKN